MPAGKSSSRLIPTGGDHKVTPAELFFDLVFVYAITQVTAMMADHTTAARIAGSLVVLALLWWCWTCFAWLGNVVRADAGGLFAVLVAVMAVMLVVSFALPEVYADKSGGVDAPLVFVLCYGTVRLLHLVSYWLSAPDDPALRATLVRIVLTSVTPPFVLLLVGAAFDGATQMVIWGGAVLLDYAMVFLTRGSGWRVSSPGHFAERHGLIVIIALGESIVAMGVGVTGYPLTLAMIAAAALGITISAGMWWMYFRKVSEPAEHGISRAEGDERTKLASDVYTYLHLPLIAGIVLAALGMKVALHQIADAEHYGLSEPLHGIVAWALPGGVGVYLLASAAILARVSGRGSLVLLLGGGLCLVGGPLVTVVPALVALALLGAAVAGMAALHSRVARPALGTAA
ncbi:low temperature requirement protein A [Streptomyces sp. TRM66268-LWL]|uniref:Low temperature requirement protein A n=1 Tax=Streptomyces polyasparticus TaxID=2767826 RepID=A0ABR7SL41_9ACTN|nr:low temperature requirement protein A [Streptomyces polyasparticus]MBC9715048.1 low temperature requirement protein A [Streptomyces polyasparticus]